MTITTQEQFDAIVRTNLHVCYEKCFATVHPSTPYKRSWAAEAISAKLEDVRTGKIKRLIVSVPPRSGKSTMCSVAYAAFLWVQDPGTKILCVSHNTRLAAKFSRQFAKVVTSDWYRRIAPHVHVTKISEDVVETSAGGHRQAASVDSGVTGLGGNIILIDDPLDASDANNALARLTVQNYYRNVLYSRLDDKVNDKIVLITQRLHVEDLSAFLLKRGYDELKLPAVAKELEVVQLWNGNTHVREVGDLLNPAHEPQSVIDEYQDTMSSSDFAAQLQQEPIPQTGTTVEQGWIMRYDRPLVTTGMDIFFSIDTAIKGTPEADYSVCQVWAKNGAKHYLIDQYRKKVGLAELVDDIAQLYRQYHPDLVLVEAQGNGTGLIDYLKRDHEIYASERRPQGDKLTRFGRAAYYFRKGQVYFPQAAPWLPDVEGEIFQSAPLNDDQIDCISQYFDFQRESEAYQLKVHNLYDPVAPSEPFGVETEDDEPRSPGEVLANVPWY